MLSSPAFLALASTTLVGFVSLCGIIFFLMNDRLLRRVLYLFLSVSTGVFLGNVFLHMLPEIFEQGGITIAIGLTIIGGMLTSFVLEKFIHWRHCHNKDCEQHLHPVGTMNLVGDFLHNALDGILIAGSYLASVPLGIATTIAVTLHEIPQELSDIGVLLYSGFTKRSALLLNFLTALAAVLGAVLVMLFASSVPLLERYLVPFAAGNFLYIAGSDLIPELHKERRTSHSILQFASIILGVTFMVAITFLE